MEEPLTFEEDPSLCFQQDEDSDSDLRRPSGVSTLKEWGAMKFPDGKWKGRCFLAVYVKEPTFVDWYLARKEFKLPWARSFLAFCKVANRLAQQARDDEDAEFREVLGLGVLQKQASAASTCHSKGDVETSWLAVFPDKGKK